MKLLSPSTKDIENCIKRHEKEWWYSDKILYLKLIEEMKKIDLCKITEEEVKGPIKVFLINWGMMGRVLNRRDKKNWQKDLLREIKHYCESLKQFRKLKLEEVDDLSGFKKDIENLYGAISKVIGPVGASKLLHLLCPNFFPLWDSAIRKKISDEWRASGHAGIDATAKGYYNFMCIISELLKKKYKIWARWSKSIKKPMLRTIDIFMWVATHNDE